MNDPIIEKLIAELQLLPSVGERSARRMAMRLFANPESGQRLAGSMTEAMQKVIKCPKCRNYTVQTPCLLCQDSKRLSNNLCIITTPQDLHTIEISGAYNGQYFVLHHLLSPIENIGISDLGINQLKSLFSQSNEISEVILALPYTVEGEITASLIISTIEPFEVPITRLSQGMPAGSDIAGMDNLTLNHALSQRTSV
jgi:recombination protein RecR